jgi:tetratricopeptide (TPR) repeat protein
MKDLKYLKVIILMISFFFFLPNVKTPCSTANLDFKIAVDKETYSLREPIWVDLYLTNNCKEAIRIKPLDLPWLVLQVFLVNSEGDTLKYSGMHFEHGSLPEGDLVKPSERYYHCINLLNSFGETTYSLEKALGRFFLREDTYTLQMNYMGVFSNKIGFKVEKPKSQEKVAHDLLKEAYYYDIKLDNQKMIDILQRLIDKYPKRLYTDLAYYELCGHYGLVGEPEKTKECLRKLVLNYPNSHFVLKAFPGLLQQMTKGEKIKFLKEVIKKQPKTRASDWAQKSLEDLEEKEEPKK